MVPNNKDNQLAVWTKWGETDPYFSVIAHELYRFNPKFENGLSPEALFQFYESGVENLNFVFEQLKIMGGKKPEMTLAMDYGCGIGRLSYALSKQFKKISSLDISKKHIQLAEHNLTQLFDKTNVAFSDISSVDFVWTKHHNTYNFIISLLVLQHIPFDSLKLTIDHLFKSLKKDGVIALQVPVFHESYNFQTGEYMNPEHADTVFLINGIQELELNVMAHENGLQNIGAVEWDCVGSKWLSKLFIYRKV